MSSPPRRSDEPTGVTAVASPDYDVRAKAQEERDRKKVSTDFHALNKELDTDRRQRIHKSTITDLFIDVCTPFLIFVMVFIVVWFLLDVRFIFTETSDGTIRAVAFFMVMGIVAANRLLARDGSDESKLLVFGLMAVSFVAGLAISGYTGSVARGFMSGGLLGALFNSAVVGFLWWMTNRLVHECCVDENRLAGDVGILTGTLRNVRRAIRPGKKEKPAPKEKRSKIKPKNSMIIETEEIIAVDPLEWKDPSKEKKEEVYIAPTIKLSERHPGISIFYFSAAALTSFAVGLPVLMQGGQRFIWNGHMYVAVFTFCALMLLLLTSLGGLRQYFRSRNVHFPPTIGVFWFGLGFTMVFMVMFGAIRLPMPSMPAMLHVEEHEIDYFSRTSDFQLESEKYIVSNWELETERSIGAVSDAVLVLFGLFIAFAILRAIGRFAASIGRRRDQFPPWVVSFFNTLDAFLVKYVRMPEFKTRGRQMRMRKGLAQSNAFSSNLRGEADATRDATESYIAHAYDALCALAYDMGVPRKDDQTPYEFIQSFPKELESIRDDARLLTDLYVRAAYSKHEMDSHTLDRLRQFWFTYDKVRSRIVR